MITVYFYRVFAANKPEELTTRGGWFKNEAKQRERESSRDLVFFCNLLFFFFRKHHHKKHHLIILFLIKEERKKERSEKK